MSELIVGRALLGIGENFIGLLGVLELGLGGLITRIAIRMMLHRQAPVGLLYVRLRGVARNTEHLVEILFRHACYLFCLYVFTSNSKRHSDQS